MPVSTKRWIRAIAVVIGIFAAWFALGVLMFDYIPDSRFVSSSTENIRGRFTVR